MREDTDEFQKELLCKKEPELEYLENSHLSILQKMTKHVLKRIPRE